MAHGDEMFVEFRKRCWRVKSKECLRANLDFIEKRQVLSSFAKFFLLPPLASSRLESGIASHRSPWLQCGCQMGQYTNIAGEISHRQPDADMYNRSNNRGRTFI